MISALAFLLDLAAWRNDVRAVLRHLVVMRYTLTPECSPGGVLAVPKAGENNKKAVGRLVGIFH